MTEAQRSQEAEKIARRIFREDAHEELEDPRERRERARRAEQRRLLEDRAAREVAAEAVEHVRATRKSKLPRTRQQILAVYGETDPQSIVDAYCE